VLDGYKINNFKLLRGRETIAELAVICRTLRGAWVYSKHYYAGSQRIVSRVGDQSITIFNGTCTTCRETNTQTEGNTLKDSNAQNADDKAIQQAQILDLQNYLDKGKLGKATFNKFVGITYEEASKIIAQDDEAPAQDSKPATAEKAPTPPAPIYYYHPDHLGSSTFLTDANGVAYQFFLNLPFGETMAEQKPSSYYATPYKFNGKELDTETGLYYYGARYYDPKMSLWLSVDPLAEKYPAVSPYTYCLNNPINMIDPDGREPKDDYKLLKNGKLELIKKTESKTDKIYSSDMKNSIEVDKGFINQKLIGDQKGDDQSYFVTKNIDKSKEAYKFFSDNSDVEFSLGIFSKGKNQVGVVSTTHDNEKMTNSDFFFSMLAKDGFKLTYHSHSHPGVFNPQTGWPAYPSGFSSDLKADFTKEGDRIFHWGLNKMFRDKIPTQFNVYTPAAPNLDVNYNFFEATRNNK
jgi:RHS repeat-associated protein